MDPLSLLILFIAGIFSSMYGSIVGGATLITVPTMIALGVNPTIAIGTNRFALLFLSGTAMTNYYRNKKIRLKLAIPLSISALLGSILGANIVLNINEEILKHLIVFFMVVLVIFILFRDKLGLKKRRFSLTIKQIILYSFVMFILGVYAGVYGAAFKTLVISLLVVVFGLSFLESSATGELILFITSLSASVVFLLNKSVDFNYAIPLSISFIIGAWAGSSLAIKKESGFIKNVFIVIVLALIIKLLFF